MIICANERAVRIHPRTIYEEERRLTAIETLTAKLLMGECSPSRTEMVAQSLQSISPAVADAIAIHLGHVGNKRCASELSLHYQQIGRLIAGSVDGYCAHKADKAARQQVGYVCPF